MFQFAQFAFVSAFLISFIAQAQNIVNINIEGREYRAREGYLLVRHKVDSQSKNIETIHALANAQVEKRFDFPEGLELVRLSNPSLMMQALGTYNKSSDILYAEPNFIWTANMIPNDPLFAKQWALSNNGQTGGTLGADISVLPAWTLTTGNKNVVLATIDTGIDYTHPDLINNAWTNSLEIPSNGIDDDANGFIDDVHGINAITMSGDPMDDHVHGTHVAGIIAAQQGNGVGISGVAPNVSVAACKFLDANGEGDTAGAVTCMNYYIKLAKRSVDPVHIVATNNSWSGGPYSQALHDAIKAHQNAGILFVAAASNDGTNNDAIDTYPANYALSNVISVAAVDHNDTLASFSNYGRASVSVASPGVDILSTLPNNKYGKLSGTSMAAPHVAGLVGLIASYYPGLSWFGIKNLVLAGGEPVGAATYTTYTGRRIVAASGNGFWSLTCANQKVTARTSPRQPSVSIKLGQILPLGVINIICDKPAQGQGVQIVATSRASSSTVVLKDDGNGPDQVAGDGVFAGVWKPAAKGNYQLRFPGNDVVSVTVTQ